MGYQVEYTKQAVKTLRKMSVITAQSILKKVRQIAEDPFSPHKDVTKLQGREGYRLRVGDWRILYEVQINKLVILVLKIGLRKEVYR